MRNTAMYMGHHLLSSSN